MNPIRTPPKAPMEAKTTPSVKENVEKFGGTLPKIAKPVTTKTTLPGKIDTPPSGSSSSSVTVPNATKLFKDAMQQLDQSGNIKTTIKATVTNSLNGLYAMVGRLQGEKKQLQEMVNVLQTAASPRNDGSDVLESRLDNILGEIHATRDAMVAEVQEIKKFTSRSHSLSPKGQKVCENKKVLQELGVLRGLIQHDVVEKLNSVPQAAQNVKLEEIKRNVIDNQRLIVEAKGQLTELGHSIDGFGTEIRKLPTYAEMAATPRLHNEDSQSPKQKFRGQQPLHSVIISSISEDNITSSAVIDKIRTAVDAKTTGLRVERLRKARDQKVVLGCSTKEELDKITSRIKNSGQQLDVEGVKNKDPLVILREVLAHNSDENIIAFIKSQNKHLLGKLKPEEQRLMVKYRRRSRNEYMCQVVMQVSPQVWTQLVDAGKIHVDLQRVRVEDQSPLVQCSKCLGYGHGRKYCTETENACSHCGGTHLRAQCPDWLANTLPSCRNCLHAKLDKTDHNAFDSECPVRKKWDRLARYSVAYC
ncbi:hypothetical protein O0L34_g14907 [Tuta absoluta]|nr:hypothetical protein O0L34_g14907 [Tuta absoluta]